MRKISNLLVLIVSLISFGVQSQEYINQDVLGKFNLESGTRNCNFISETLLEQKAKIIFYAKTNSKALMMSNFWAKDATQSFGEIRNVAREHAQATETMFENDTYFFDWDYENTYNDLKGTAKVKLLLILTPYDNYYELTIVAKSLDVLVYRGYEKDLSNLKALFI